MGDAQAQEKDTQDAFSLRRAAAACPGALALRIDAKDYDFSTLNALAQGARGILDEHWDGCSPVALVCTRSLDSLLFLFACLEREVPLLCVHPRWSEGLRQDIIEQVAPLFVKEDKSLDLLPSGPKRHPLPSKTQILIATSGSTAKPKIVLLSKSALLASARGSAHNLPWQEGDRWLLSLPFAHIGGLSIVLRCLEAQKAIVCEALDPKQDDFSSRLDHFGVTLLSLVPAQLHAWLQSGNAVPQRLRAILVGGSSVSQALVREARTRGLPVLCTYGLSEMASQVATQNLADLNRSDLTTDSGRPLSGIEVRVAEDGRLHVKGPQLMLSYLGRSPKQTFKDGWFATCDRATLESDGRLTIVGRMDHVIISGGENVSPEWIETVLPPLRDVSELCVAALDDAKWGQRVVAAVVLDRANQESPPSKQHLADWFSRAAACLPNYARPKEYIRLDALPRTPGGKVDRAGVQRALMDQRK